MRQFSKNILNAALITTGLILAAPTLAQMVPEKVQNGTTYVSGGVGDDEVKYFRSVRGQYNLHLLVTGKKGEYLADVPVKVVDNRNQTVLDVATDGPYLYAKLPTGRYQVIAGSTGTQKRVVQVSTKGGPDVHFTF